MKRIVSVLALLLAALLLLSGCRKTTPEPAVNLPVEPDVTAIPTEEPTPEPPAGEYVVSLDGLKAAPSSEQNRVFYEIFVGSFSDSSGDGVGDLRGILNRLDYLNDGDPDSGKSLGVEGLWLTPIFASPSYHKYDVSDYYKIDPKFGSEADLVALLDACHARGVKVILDMVINHSSNRCEWFKAFTAAHQNGDTNSEYYDFYSWYDASKDKAPSGRTFQKISGTTHYYECNFYWEMPEFNFDNEQVREQVLDIAKYYLDLGVDGFRFDAAKYVYFNNHSDSVKFWQWYIGELRAYKPDVYTVAEVWDGDGITNLYFRALNCFDFTTAESSGLIADTAKKGDVNTYTGYVEAYQNKVKSYRAEASYTPFITNHDMDRAAGFLTTSAGTIQMAANLYLLGPGSPFIYYGEEIGLRGSRGNANTDANRRLAMIWGDGDKIKDPEGTTYSKDNQIKDSVADQEKDPNSLYNYYKKVLMVRRANPEIADGTYKALKLTGTKVGGFLAEKDGSAVLVLHNTTGSEKTVNLAGATDKQLGAIRAVVGFGNAKLNGTELTLDAQTSVVIGCK